MDLRRYASQLDAWFLPRLSDIATGLKSRPRAALFIVKGVCNGAVFVEGHDWMGK